MEQNFYSAHKGLNLLLKICSTDNEPMAKLHNNAKKKKKKVTHELAGLSLHVMYISIT